MPRSWDFDHTGIRNAWGSALSPDGSLMINMYGFAETQGWQETGKDFHLHVLDVRTGEEVAVIPGMDQWVNDLEYDPVSGVIVGIAQDLIVIDSATWEATTLSRPGGLINGFAISPNGDLVATVGIDEYVAVWDIESQSLVAEIPIIGWIGEGLRGIAFEDDTTIIVAPEAGSQLLRFSLDRDTLLGQAFESLDRGFRPEECATYGIDPCPTLEEMQSG
jgi:WD40 repeat protein